MFTAAAVLRELVETGTVALEDQVTQHVDPFLARNNHPGLTEHFNGTMIERVTIG